MLWKTRARTCATTAPTKNRTSPTAAATPIGRNAASPTTRPAAPAALSAPSNGSQDRGTPTAAELARTNRASTQSAAAAPALAAAVTTVTAVYRVSTGDLLGALVAEPGRRRRRAAPRAGS